ncbi:MAG: hypothetical protein RR128_08655 [Clostridium sp.]
MEFNGSVLIADPCAFVKDEDWKESGYGEHLESFGINKYMIETTISGDGIYVVIGADHDEEYGEVAIDSGRIGVFSLEEVLNYNPEFMEEMHERCVTVIENFEGEMDYYYDKDTRSLGIGSDGNINILAFKL